MNITITHDPKAIIGKYTVKLDGETKHSSNSIHPSELLSILGIDHKFNLVTK